MMMRIHNSDCFDAMRGMDADSIDAIVTDPPYGLGFMGRKWDYQLPPMEAWQEALRVAKPGAHLLAFGGSRTYHRMACVIEDAGWEIRDCIMWVYGGGFPKSFDIGKKLPEWKGHGTCLKPAYEPIIVARKPLDGTVADNVLKWGTGVLDIDGCRIPGTWSPKNTNAGAPIGKHAQCVADHSWGFREIEKRPHVKGRYPANFVHDGSEEVLALFPETKAASGTKTFGKVPHDTRLNCYGSMVRDKPWTGVKDDGGSVARFFYCAKAAPSERGRDNKHPTVKPLALMRWCITLVAPPNAVVLDPFMGSGTTGIAALQLGRKFVGIERDSEYFRIAKARIEGAELPLFALADSEKGGAE